MAKNNSRHGGNIRSLAEQSGLAAGEILDFSANINPLGFPESLRPVLARSLGDVLHYPDPECKALTSAFCARWKVPSEEVLFANGSEEIFYLLPRALKKERALIPVPAYADYAVACRTAGLPVTVLPLREENGFAVDFDELENALKGDEIVFLGNPANPTGLTIDTDRLCDLARRKAGTIFVIDEAFADFVDNAQRLIAARPANVVVTGSFTKIYAIPGLRLGFVAAAPEIIENIRPLMPAWSVSTLAQAAGEALLSEGSFEEATRSFLRNERPRLVKALSGMTGLFVYPGRANYLLLRIDRPDIDAPQLAEKLLKTGIAIRVCTGFDGLDKRFSRIAVRTEEENNELIAALGMCLVSIGKSLGPLGKTRSAKKKPALMFQGTGSNAGKSILTAAMCRILLQDGYSVAPFKAQNMSLNSFVTKDGGEMGRAQVVQAQACRLDPDVIMNPILLKPNSDTGSQVIIMGKPVGNMDVNAYIEYKPQAFETAKNAYDELSKTFDVIVLEGAGSPAEVNLKHHDIVNMAMARYAASPVVLVGDIDRGGVFASFVGTMEVLAEWERRLVAGFLVNRFRGQKDLLGPAMDYTRLHTGLPTFGVVPYLANLGLPEEDSVTFKALAAVEEGHKDKEIDIAVIDLPHISNFTDLDSLRLEPDVGLRIVRSRADLGTPDALILPGSKNVIGDINYLASTGIGDAVTALAATGRTEIVGICGGLQIIGSKVADPYGIESAGKSTMDGLGLIPVATTLMEEKHLTATGARHAASGHNLRGYEIHHGETDGNGLTPSIVRDDGEPIGYERADSLVWGTYLHGIFDADPFRRWFVDRLRSRRGLAPVGKVVAVYDLEPALDRLADVVRNSVEIKEIYRVMGIL